MGDNPARDKCPEKDSEKTIYWELPATSDTDSPCYALASFQEIRSSSQDNAENKFLKGDGSEEFAKKTCLRVLKMTVCKKRKDTSTSTQGETMCATKKVTVSCWYLPGDNDNGDQVSCTKSGTTVGPLQAIVMGRG